MPLTEAHIHLELISVVTESTNLANNLFILKNHINFQFKVLTCVSGIDCPKDKQRFNVVYELLSVKYNYRLRVRAFTNELIPLTSATRIFPVAGCYESEIWDMFGIFFQGHENLTRLLTDYGFEGYPLRKDFPLSGFVETSYDYSKKQVLNSKLEMSQETKILNIFSPWAI